MVNTTPQPPYPRKRDAVPIVQEAEWAARPVWTGAENLASTGIRFPDRPARHPTYFIHNGSYIFTVFCFLMCICQTNSEAP
jgi:hypothetical protein